MKPRWQIGWIVFALAMLVGECLGDIPRLFHPHRISDSLMPLANAIAILGLTFYAFRWDGSRGFWRLYAPIYAMVLAALIGTSLIPLMRVLVAMVALGKATPLVALGALTATVPIWAMVVFTLVALFRLGDWIGPTRRPVGVRQQQLSLPL